jgi:biopolymer transport protein ExbD
MPRIRAKRANISLDMTAMCDMAFLLLTFFMLATKFKPEEAVSVNMPSSVSENKLAESNVITLSVEKNGGVFFGMDGEHDRKALLDKISDKYKIAFSDEEKYEFSLLPNFGTNIGSLKSVLAADKDGKKALQKGIPKDSAQNELRDWIYLASLTNPKAEVAIKADMEVDYPVVEKIIETLQELNINKFKLVTSLEQRKK